jgi:hypothetical protein
MDVPLLELGANRQLSGMQGGIVGLLREPRKALTSLHAQPLAGN